MAKKPVHRTIVKVFKPRGRAVDFQARSLIPTDCIAAVSEKLGEEAAMEVEAKMKAMAKNGLDFIQLSVGDRRIRITQEEIA
jgi:hypothetical protein